MPEKCGRWKVVVGGRVSPKAPSEIHSNQASMIIDVMEVGIVHKAWKLISFSPH